jgi:Na+/H+-translocating membrane pyrophosphatase
MNIHHMPPPVVLSRERFAALLRISTCRLRAMILPCLVVLVIDMAIEMRLGAKSLATALMRTLMWSLVIPLVVASEVVSNGEIKDCRT